MTAERAKQIADAIWASHCWGDGGATPEEDREIKAFWELCPGWYSYFDAVHRMGRGEEPPT